MLYVYVYDYLLLFFFFFSSRRRHTRCLSDWSSDVCSSDLFSWGYNRDWYSKSDIHVYGYDPRSHTNYDFMLYDAKAKDKRSEERRVGKECRSRESRYN